MLVAGKLPILPHLLAAPAQPTQLANLPANPLIYQYARRDVVGLFTVVEKTSNGYCSSAGRLQILTNTHTRYKLAYPSLSHPRKLTLTYGAFNAV